MSEDVIALLQKSLAENEQVKRRQLAAFAVLFVATVTSLFWIGHLAAKPGTDVRELIVWAVIGVFVAICYAVMALAIYINRTTARVLRTLKIVSEQL